MKTPVSIQGILDAANSSGRHVAGLRGDFRSRLNAFRRHRSAEEQQELTEDFRHVLAAWGIADADIPGVISALRLRLPVFAVPMLACLITAAWSHSPLSFLSLACVAPPCLLGMVTTLWRISILRNHRFTPLCRWLLRFRKRP
ncbi:hypothetical protein [Bilophila wadsworthia]|jgi:hypothetical protein|uniref:hypothetical protein n=1 Tax=Bilophila wadsworthia TaxID=35833 RepID=UPI00290FCC93|nr:hypothetical protein [Bilophila wadsworthia]MDU4375982.1 hypothetical protein [Bilophila wadsworthia]